MNTAKLLEIISSYNRFWTTGSIDAGIKRDLLSPILRQLDSKEVVILKGVRRCGKSTLLAQIISHLLDKGTPPTRILRINLEEPLFATEYSIGLLEQIYRTFREHVQSEGKCFLFLDEVQNIPEWERWVRGRNETEDIKIFITGSSAEMLSREIGTKLTGRHLSFEVFPLSFKEFLFFFDIAIFNEMDYLRKKNVVRKLFLDYIQYGGFPEIVLKQENADKELLLKSYFEDILYRDIAARHEIRDIRNLRNLAVYFLTNTTKLTSINKLKKNFGISQDKTENYVSAILESYLMFQLQKFSFSLKSIMRAGFKPYSIDSGLRNRVAFSFSQDTGRLVENIVFCYLRQKYEEVYFHTDGGEADFVVRKGMKFSHIIQVWYDDPIITSVPDRELACFKASKKYFDCAERILITNDYEYIIKLNTGDVQCVPITKFLLQ